MATDAAPRPDDVEALVLAAVRSVVSELRPRRPPPVRLDSDLERDLGLDSLALAELLVRVEDTTGVALPERVLRTVTTCRDLVREAGRGRAGTGARRLRAVAPEVQGETPEAEIPQSVTTLADSLAWHATVHPDRLHVRVLEESGEVTGLTYGALQARARTTATGLLELGLAPGESVAIMLPTSPAYFEVFLGVLLAGAIPVPIYPPTRPSQLAEHLERQRRILDNARATLLVTVPEARQVSRLLRSSVDTLRDIRSPDELLGTGAGPLPVLRTEDIALLQYTSGSTGTPKGVVLTHQHLLANIDAMARAAQVGPDDVFVSWLPLYHDMGLIGAWLGSLHIGMPLVSMSPLSFLLRPARWLQAIDAHRATIAAAPNFAYELCLHKVDDAELDGLDLSSWRLAFNGAEAVHPNTLRRFTERLAPHGFRLEALMPVYGLAEAGVGLAFPPVGRGPVVDRIRRSTFADTGRAEPVPADGDADTDTIEVVACGITLPGYEIRVVDDADRELPDRTEGHVHFRGPSATSGYFRNPDATRRLFHDDWLDTGDLGYLADGDLHVTGRVKDLIIRAGRNLHPDELEHELDRLPSVRRGCVAVFAAPDPVAATERLVVVAETRETDDAARAELRDRIVARTVDVVGTPPDDVVVAGPGTVPKTSSGKVRRAEARARYEAGELGPREEPVWRQVGGYVLGGLPVRVRRLRRRCADAVHVARVWTLVVGAGIPIVALLAVLPGRRLRWYVARGAARHGLRLCGMHVHVRGATLPDGPAVIVANHGSWLDGIVLAAVLPGQLRFVAGEVLTRRVLSGTVLRRIGAVFVERWDREQSIADAAQLAELPRAGARLVVFPEGGLSVLPGLRSFHLGGFAAAATSGVPVVPVAIRGARSMMRPGGRRVRRGSAAVVIGSPIEPTGADWRAAIELRDAARAHILRHCGEPDLS